MADLVPNFDNIGLLEQISEQDLLETDLYVFRESTGELVVEKLNFARDGERTETPQNGVDEQSSTGYFELTIPGQDASNSFRSVYRDRSLYKDYEDWQASLGIQESSQGYQADSLRVGESLTLVVINRATGYLGTASTSVLDVTEQSINIELPDIKLFPPNLQVQVDRQYQVDKGLTAGQTRNYRVGSEGAALTSDQYVSIHTQWLNHDGTALPSELPGYTGRLANLIGDAELNPSSANHFSIAPGKHTEVIQLPNAALSTAAAHQYLHVVGRELNAMPDAPDFGADPSSEFPERPGQFVPIKVAVYDEEASEGLQKTQQALELEGVQQDSSVYRWVYRPEMQYSVFELDVSSILKTEEDADSSQELLEEQQPIIEASDELLEITSTLITEDYDPLTFFAPEGDWLYSLAQYEALAGIGQGTEASNTSFESLGHIGNLDSSDFLSLNLINSEDRSNVLWEFVYGSCYLVSDETLVSASDPGVQLTLICTGAKSDENSEVTVAWRVAGPGGKLEQTLTTSLNEVFTNVLSTSHSSGDEYVVSAEVMASEDSGLHTGTRAVSPLLSVIPGPAHHIVLSAENEELAADTLSKTQVTAYVQDAYSNPLLPGSLIGWQLNHDGELSESASELDENGGATVSYTVGSSALDTRVIASSGTATQSLVVSKLSVSAALTSDKSRIGAGSQDRAVLTVRSDAVDGTPVIWNTTHGQLIGADSTIEDGQAVATLLAGKTGVDAMVSVAVAGSTHAVFVEHMTPLFFSDLSVTPSTPVIVGEASDTGFGSTQIETVDGKTTTHSYPTRTTLAIRSGDVGLEELATKLNLGTPNQPNAMFSRSFGFTHIIDQGTANAHTTTEILSHEQSTPARLDVVGAVSVDTTLSTTLPGTSLKFSGGHLQGSSVLESDELEGLSASLSFLTASDQLQNLIQNEDADGLIWRLSLDVGGSAFETRFLNFHVRQDDGNLRRVRVPGVKINQWQRAGFRIGQGRVELQVDDQISVIEFDAVSSGAGTVSVGKDFLGNLDDL